MIGRLASAVFCAVIGFIPAGSMHEIRAAVQHEQLVAKIVPMSLAKYVDVINTAEHPQLKIFEKNSIIVLLRKRMQVRVIRGEFHSDALTGAQCAPASCAIMSEFPLQIVNECLFSSSPGACYLKMMGWSLAGIPEGHFKRDDLRGSVVDDLRLYADIRSHLRLSQASRFEKRIAYIEYTYASDGEHFPGGRPPGHDAK